MSATSGPDELVEIATALEGVGASLASLRMSSDNDFATTSAYAALLAARADVNGCLDGPPPGDNQGDINEVEVVDALNHLYDALARYARTHGGTAALACARAALCVDDAREHLAGEAS